jgi:hypothetical protein
VINATPLADEDGNFIAENEDDIIDDDGELDEVGTEEEQLISQNETIPASAPL